MAQFPSCKLENLGIFVTAKMAVIGPTGYDSDDGRQAGIDQIEPVLKKSAQYENCSILREE